MSAWPSPLLDLWRQLCAQLQWQDGLLALLSPLFLLCVGLEWLWWRRAAARAQALGRSAEAETARRIYDWRDSLDSLNLGGVYTVVDIAFVILGVLPAMDWVARHAWHHWAMTPWRFVLLYLGVEVCYYAFHRASHRIRWFWCAHVVHHGSEHMNFTAAMRQSWLYSVAGNWLFYLPMVWLGFAPRWVLLALSINLAYQFFVHTQAFGKAWPWFEAVFNTPSHHRVHHGRNPRYIDCNYGGTLIVFDRLFGSFVSEDEAVDYGLVRPVHSHNPLWLTLHEWVAMLRDLARPGPWSVKLQHLWRPPEWQRPPTLCADRTDNRAHATQRAP